MGLATTVGIFDGAQVAAGLVSDSPWRVFLWTYLTAYLVAFLVLYPAAVGAVHRSLGTGRPFVLGWTAFAVYQGILLVFIR